MSAESLEGALLSDLALARLESELIRSARRLHAFDFSSVSRAQMAAVEQTIAPAASHAKAVADASRFLEKSLEKLRSEADRSDRKKSWLQPARDAAPSASLGDTLIEWLKDSTKYHPADTDSQADPLTALKRFWSRFYALYRYRAATGRDMPLSVLDREAQASPQSRSRR